MGRLQCQLWKGNQDSEGGVQTVGVGRLAHECVGLAVCR